MSRSGATPSNLNQPTDSGITYDTPGNLKIWYGWTCTYDAQNRLTGAIKGATTLSCFYDGKNRQVARSINGAITFSVWDDWELVEEYGTGNVRTAAFVQGAHGPIKSLLNNIYFYQDSLGSTSHIASATGALLEYYKYDLNGKPTYWNASNVQITASAYNVRDLFTGERFISEIGVYDLRNRFYSPDLSRFLQPDPIGFKGDGSNLYRYCGNDWANKTDPMGLQTGYQSSSYSFWFGKGCWETLRGLITQFFEQPAGNGTMSPTNAISAENEGPKATSQEIDKAGIKAAARCSAETAVARDGLERGIAGGTGKQGLETTEPKAGTVDAGGAGVRQRTFLQFPPGTKPAFTSHNHPLDPRTGKTTDINRGDMNSADKTNVPFFVKRDDQQWATQRYTPPADQTMRDRHLNGRVINLIDDWVNR